MMVGYDRGGPEEDLGVAMEYYNDNGNFFEAVMHGTPNLGPVDFLIGATSHADDQELYWKNQAKVSSGRLRSDWATWCWRVKTSRRATTSRSQSMMRRRG